MARVLLALDFDWTLVNGNSDPWVVRKIGAGHIFEECDRVMLVGLMECVLE